MLVILKAEPVNGLRTHHLLPDPNHAIEPMSRFSKVFRSDRVDIVPLSIALAKSFRPSNTDCADIVPLSIGLLLTEVGSARAPALSVHTRSILRGLENILPKGD